MNAIRDDTNLERTQSRIISGQKLITVAGAAGTGKTHLIQQLIDVLRSEAICVTLTGQAANMLRKRGVEAACTIHSLIYLPEMERPEKMAAIQMAIEKTADENEKIALQDQLVELKQPGFVLRDAQLPRVIIIDEAPMIGKNVAQDLVSFDRQIVAVGDPYQLPPVEGEPYFNLNNPDIKLTTVHRQKQGGILDLATATRKLRRFDRETGASFLKPWPTDPKEWLLPQAVICYTNNCRRKVNRLARKAHGGGPRPDGRENEKIICLKNYKKLGLFNGSSVRLQSVYWNKGGLYGYAEVLRQDADDWRSCGKHLLYGGHFKVTELGLKKAYADRWLAMNSSVSDAIELDWAYCITCHKAQGSEFENVTIIRERCQKDWRWDYTALTRAKTSLSIVEC